MGVDNIKELQIILKHVEEKMIPEIATFCEKIYMSFGNIDEAMKAGTQLEKDIASMEFIKDLAKHGDVAGFDNIAVKEIQALEKQLFEEAAETVGKGGGMFIEKEVAKAIEKSGLGVSDALLGAVAKAEIDAAGDAGMSALRGLYGKSGTAFATFDPASLGTIVLEGEKLMVQHAPTGYSKPLSDWMSETMKGIAKDNGKEVAAQWYKTFMEGVGKSSQFTEMSTQLANVLQREAAGELKEGFLKAIVTDFDGYQMMNKEMRGRS